MHNRRAIVLSTFFFLFVDFPTLLAYSKSLKSSPAPLSSKVLPPDADAILAFKTTADLDQKLRLPLRKHFDYCMWIGVKCMNGKVVRLVLENLQLRGTLEKDTLSRLDQLRILSLQNNSLSGPIPDLSRLANLKTLFLDHNNFTGHFPLSILSLHRVRIVDLSYNNFRGEIPEQIASLGQLYYLKLEFNLFNGTIPPLNQSTLRIFNISGNNFTGVVPFTSVLSSFDISSFLYNPRLCGQIIHRQCQSATPFFISSSTAQPPEISSQLQTAPPPPTITEISSTKKQKKRVLIIGSSFCFLFLIGSFMSLFFVTKKHQRRRARSFTGASTIDIEENDQVEKSSSLKTMKALSEVSKSGSLIFCAGESRPYTLEQLMKASAEILGRGTMGTTYKAVLDNRLTVSVKRLDAGKNFNVGKDGFERHMQSVGSLRHPNLVSLRSYLQAKEERLLIYDYQPNGSIFSLIYGSKSSRAKPFHWTSCLKIAEDVAQGLAYIHQASGLLHGNLKSSNVLLGIDFEACLTDYCLITLFDLPEEDNIGYRAPENRKSNRPATSKSDIYAFGVLLIELLTGKPPLEHPFLSSTDMMSWVRATREEVNDDNHLEMLLDIAISCVKISPDQRPTAWQVLRMIQEIKNLEVGDDDSSSPSYS